MCHRSLFTNPIFRFIFFFVDLTAMYVMELEYGIWKFVYRQLSATLRLNRDC